MTTQQIYEEYMVPRNLQEHMLRVASLAKIILNHWVGRPVDRDSIVQACTFHDIAKPMTFDPAKQAQFGMSKEDIVRLETLQKRLKRDYGTNEHTATVIICQHIGCTRSAVNIVGNLEWSNILRLLKANDIESLLPIYCDMRIGPTGILTLKQRLAELQAREGKSDYEENGMKLEHILAGNTTTDLNSISNTKINGNFEELLNLDISQ